MKPIHGAAEAHRPRKSIVELQFNRGLARPWLSLVPVASIFLAAIWQIRLEWAYDEAYHYGWSVPALMGYLISVRWRDRPVAQCGMDPSIAPWTALGVAFVLIWLIREANPDWRLMGVALSGLAIASGLLWFRDAGGRAWQRHFAGAVGFFALGVPWPTVVEQAITGVLMPANAALTLEALHWLGVPAIRTGNLITLREGTLGVEEACSGIRSLQATLMMGLFLGELHWLRRRDRCLLLGIGVGLALLTNALRTICLSTLAARAGLEEAERWHDSAGLTVLVLHGAILWAACLGLARRARRPVRPTTRNLPSSWPARGPAVLASALVLAVPVTRFWFGRNGSASVVEWTLVPPRDAPAFGEYPISDRTRLILRFGAGWSARWGTPQGHQLHGFFLTWGAGQAPPEILHSHEPGNCLTLAGMTLVRTHPEPLHVEITPDHAITFQGLEFSDRGRPLHVFHAVEETVALSTNRPPAPAGLTRHARLHAAWTGQRSQGLRLIEVGIWNAADDHEARAVMTEFLNASLRRPDVKR